MSDREGDEAGVAGREDDGAGVSWRSGEADSEAGSGPMGDEDGPEIKGAGPGAEGAEAVGVVGGLVRRA